MTTPKRTPPGWQPGQSGNPAGRPKGSGDVALIRAAIAQRMPELIDTLVDRALSGDVGAARLLLERTVAPLKASEAPQAIHLPPEGLSDQGRAVLASVASGELAAGQGAQLLGAIGTLARVIEVDELTQRVQALEARHANA